MKKLSLILATTICFAALCTNASALSISIGVGDEPYYIYGPGYWAGGIHYCWIPGHWNKFHTVWIHGHYRRC
jgi:hypothetical protein